MSIDDEIKIAARKFASMHKVPYLTTRAAANAAYNSVKHLKTSSATTVKSLQERL